MSAIGKIGEGIVRFQFQIEVLILIIFAAIIAWLIYRAVTKKSSQKDILTEISEKVENIDQRISNIETGRGLKDSAKKIEEAQTETTKSVKIEVDDAVKEDTADADDAEETVDKFWIDSSDEELSGIEPAESPADIAQVNPVPGTVNRDRTSGTDKFGKTYTEEMLKEQIR